MLPVVADADGTIEARLTGTALVCHLCDGDSLRNGGLESGGVEWIAKRDLEEGAGLTMSIGNSSNLQLAAAKGAAVTSNPNDFVLMRFRLGRSDMWFEARWG